MVWLVLSQFQPKHSQRGQREGKGIGHPVTRPRLSLEPSRIADVAATVYCRIAVQEFTIQAWQRDSHPVVGPGNRREVTDEDYEIIWILGLTQESYDRLVCIAEIYPPKPRPIKIYLMKRWFGPIESVQIARVVLKTPVGSKLEQVPLEARIVVPLPPLT